MAHGIPPVESPFFDTYFQNDSGNVELLRVARELRDKGFSVIDLPERDFDRLSANIIRDLNPQYDFAGWRDRKVDSLRVQDAWRTHDDVRRIAANSGILTLLSKL